MSLRGVLPGVVLGAALIVAAIAVSLAGAAFWKGALPGEDTSAYASAYATVPAGVRSAIAGAATAATPTPAAPAAPAAPSPTPTRPPAATPPAGQARTAAPATATPSPAAAPLSLQLVVCDASVDCGEDPRQTEWREVNACLRSSTDAPDRPLVLAITPRNEPPSGPTDAAVIARSGLVRPTTALQCYAVRAVNAPLVRGAYWIWALEGSTSHTRLRIVLGR